MSVVSVLPRDLPVTPVDPYFQPRHARPPIPELRPLTELERMYTYWGADRA